MGTIKSNADKYIAIHTFSGSTFFLIFKQAPEYTNSVLKFN